MAEIQNIRTPADEHLMAEICEGNRLAFELLYDRYFQKLVWFARGFLADVQMAEDAVQEVFIQIMEKPEKFDRSRKFSTWVYTLTGNSCKNRLRNAQNRNRLLEENRYKLYPESVEIDFAEDQERVQEQIRNAFETLNEKEKNIFVLRFEQERSIKEIAELAQIPEGSVKSGIYYLLKKLGKQLKEIINEN